MSQLPVVQAKGLEKTFNSGLIFQRKNLAVRDASLRIESGKTLAVIGESGCGKSTLGRMVAGLLRPDMGSVLFSGRNLSDWPRKEFRRKLQIVFQDADGSLNPNLKTCDLLLEPLCLQGWSERRAKERLPELMEMVGLTTDLLRRHPHEISGGQRQRIGLARAMSLGPELVIADEPVASLDRSVQAHILSLFKKYQNVSGVAYLYISHDLASVRVLADDVAVMLGGVFVETGPAVEVFREPIHPYTRLLLEVEKETRELDLLVDLDSGRINSLGCPFALLCPIANSTCRKAFPSLVSYGSERTVRCERVLDMIACNY